MIQIFIEDPGNSKHPKNVKTNNNSNCHVITRLVIVK